MSHQRREPMINLTWQKSRIHSRASKVGVPIHVQNYQLCDCCDQPIEKAPIKLSEHTKEFQIFGFGYSLYFSFLKCCIYLTLVLIASKTSSELYRATKENFKFCFSEKRSSPDSQISNSFNPNPASRQKTLSLNSQHSIHYRYLNGQQDLNYFHSKKITRNLVGQEEDIISKGLMPSKIVKRHQSIPYALKDHQKLSENESAGDQAHNSDAKCTSFMVYFSLFKEQLYYEGTFLRIVEFLMHLIALVTIRNMILKEQQYFDERMTSLSDYSIIISRLPQATGHAKRLQTLFYYQFKMTYGYQNSQIKQIIFLFKDRKLEEINEKKKKIKEYILENIDEENDQSVQQGIKNLEILSKEQENRAIIVRENIKNDNVSCTKMIIVFNKEAEKAEIIRAYKQQNSKGFEYSKYFQDIDDYDEENATLAIKQAPQPNQIIWQHIDESDEDRKALIWKANALTFGFLAVTTVIFYLVLLAKTRLFISAIQMDPESEKANRFRILARVIVYLAIFGVVLFNKFVMSIVLHKIVHNQNHAFVDKQNHSFSIKYSIGMFFTTALMTLAVEAITFRNFYSHQYGVIEEQTIMFFVTAFLIPLIWLINPYNLQRKFQRRRHKHKLVSQEKANLLSEDIAYDLGKRYAEIFEIMWFTFLYSELIPLGSFLILIGLVLYFWVDKYNFLRNSVLKVGVSGKMAILALKSLDATLFMPSAGQILFDAVLRSKFDGLALTLTLCGIAYLFLPVSKMIWFFNSEKFFLQEKTYEQTKYSFKETYYTHHPAYKRAFTDLITHYKKRYSDRIIEDAKTVKVYGSGRGTYKQDHYASEDKLSNPISLPFINGSLRSKLIG